MFTRIISSLIGFPLVVLLLLFANQLVIDIAFSVIAIVCLMEFYNAFSHKNIKPIAWVGYLAAASIAFMHLGPKGILQLFLLASIPVIVILLFLYVIISKIKVTPIDVAVTILGIFYIVGFIMFIPFIRNLENGHSYIWYIIFSSWGTDTFAYFIGIKFGKHKFTKISPKKSIEGCIGGIIGSIVICFVYTIYLNVVIKLNINYTYIVLASVVLSVISQIGDLAASSIKRYNGIKDFGNLIPGHGGLLDRLDSMIFVAPLIFFIFKMGM